MQTADTLVRKKYLISSRQVKKLEILAKKQTQITNGSN
jgi:hypothetical protein